LKGVADELGVGAHIAREAARLFARRGYDATSVREIAEAAGVTKPTLYYHFGSKEGLAQALLNRPLEGMIGEMEAIQGSAAGPVERLAGLIEVQFSFCREDPDRFRFLYALFFGPLGSGLAADVSGYSERIDRLMDRAMGAVVEAGIVALGRGPGMLAAVRGLIVVHTVEYLYRGSLLEPGLGGRIVAELLRGFGTGTCGVGGAG
jgi:AcrR family transcriptional regulator